MQETSSMLMSNLYMAYTLATSVSEEEISCGNEYFLYMQSVMDFSVL